MNPILNITFIPTEGFSCFKYLKLIKVAENKNRGIFTTKPDMAYKRWTYLDFQNFYT